MQTKVINLIGAPCAGKSTLAAGLFHEMKRNYMSVELVTEYAKDLTYDGHKTENMDQLSVFAEQHRRIARLIGKVEYVITDSPLYLSAYYASKTDTPLSFRDYAISMANKHDNLNFLVTRNHRYDPNGRSQDEAGANKIHDELIFFMNYWNISYTKVLAGDEQPIALYNQLFGNGEVKASYYEEKYNRIKDELKKIINMSPINDFQRSDGKGIMTCLSVHQFELEDLLEI